MEVKQIKSKFLRNIFDQNTYVLSSGDEAVIIDAGAEIEDVKASLGERKVLAVLLTHLHFDHLWNIEKYIAEFHCDVYVQKQAEEKLLDPNKNASNILKKGMTFIVPKNKLKYYAEKLFIGNFEFEIYKTPGHSSDCVCIKTGDYLFSGDTIFEDAIGRTDFYDGSPEDMKKSLKLIENLNFKIACPGHFNICKKDKLLQVIKLFT